MIIKSYEIDKKDLKQNRFFLLYGENQGHKNEIIKNKFFGNVYRYEESEIIGNEEAFFNNILSKSFFENEKLIIVSRATDKIKVIIEEIIDKNVEDVVIVLNANTLEKKSKLRSFFEKDKRAICVAFYEDNGQTLVAIASSFFRKNKIPISQQSINLLVARCRGDRQNLNNELEKIENFISGSNKIEIQDLLKLTNLAENYNVSELIDSCLSKNKTKTINILNENIYSLEDCVLITRTFLIKSKRLLKICKEFQDRKNIDAVISNFRPPIFWKDKEIVKQQAKCWSINNAEDLIYKINDIELLVKKNSSSALKILSNFIIEQTTIVSN